MALVRAATDAAEPEDYTMPRVGARAVIIDSALAFFCRALISNGALKSDQRGLTVSLRLIDMK